ncbi:MAG: hypothetical protein ABIO46_14925 [Chitinophagales bacterium]
MINSKSFERRTWYSNSEADPAAKVRNRLKSGSLLLPQPSAMFVGMEEDERLICDVIPYTSVFGNEAVTL